MAKSRFCLLVFLFSLSVIHSTFSLEGTPKVPSQMDFGGIRLKITDAARADIQQQVDALRVSEKYFRLKLDRVLLYFPIIERILKEEDMPDDIKYLVIQESGLVSDAVSSANAVGFWMFKEPAGREVGLRIDKYVDERLNIVSSTRGACRYIKRHNFFFKNWVYSVIAHNTGRAGAERHVDKQNFGASRMTIDKDTHWYFKTFLAHVIAFRDEIGGKPSTGMVLREYRDGGGKTLDKIAKEFKVDEELVFQYNKWLQRGPVPTEKNYSVIIPLTGGSKEPLLAKNPEKPSRVAPEVVEDTYPVLKEKIDSKIASFIIDVNNIPAIIAGKNDDLKALAEKSGTEVKRLAKFNDISPKARVVAGQVYYQKRKRSSAKIYFHTVQPGETLWGISQQYGVKLKKLAKKNRMLSIDELVVGRTLWLRKTRPASVPVEVKDVQEIRDEIAALKPEPPATTEHGKTPESALVQEEQAPVEEVGDPIEAAAEPMRQLSERDEPNEDPDGEAITTAEPAGKIHVVKQGETLYGIARNYGLAVNELMEWNDLNNSLLSVGQELHVVQRDTSDIKEVLNPAVNTHPGITVHIVQSGDTMYSISRKYNVSLQHLMKMNNKENFVLSIGEKLIISE